MPLAPGTRRYDALGGRDVVWDGQGWKVYTPPSSESMAPAPAPGEQESALGGWWNTVNPMNVVRAVAHPLDTISNMVGSQVDQGKKAVDALQRFLGGEIPAGLEAVGHGAAAALPVLGPAAAHAGEVMGGGQQTGGTVTSPNVAAGMGELAGLLTPEVALKSGPALSAAGRGAEALGTSKVANIAKAAGVGDMLFRGDLAHGGAAVAVPYALEYGGKGLQAAGDAIARINARLTGTPAEPTAAAGAPTITDLGNVAEPSTAPQLRPARYSTAAPSEPEGGWAEYKPQYGVEKDIQAYDKNRLRRIENRPVGMVYNHDTGELEPATTTTETTPAPAPSTTPASISALTPEEQGYAGAGQLRTGANLPGAMGPSELLREPEASAPVSYEMSAAPKVPESLRSLERGDEFWGPGSKTRAGELSMANEPGRGSQLLYDPQTPTSYLREQLRTAMDPAERAFLAKALQQRYNIARRPARIPDAVTR